MICDRKWNVRHLTGMEVLPAHSPQHATTQSASMGQLQWRFSQCFGDKGEAEKVAEGTIINEADIISAVEFESSGEYFATGDRGGRVVLFERNSAKKTPEYKFYTEFQSHEPEFDYLKSLEIEERINKIRWLKRQHSHFLLSTNDKTVKLWKISEKTLKVVAECASKSVASCAQLRLPKITTQDTIITAHPRRIFNNAHAYPINSVSANSDGETFVSGDDLCLNLWNLNVPSQSFTIVDLTPPNMEELTEVITCAECHPVNCNILMYSISKGAIRLADMRCAALCDSSAKVLQGHNDASSKTIFTEIINSISDAKFSSDGRYVLSRDYLTMKLWDVNMENRPVKVMQIHDHLQSKLCNLYENEFIFDKFDVAFGAHGKYALTGSYNYFFQIYNTSSKEVSYLQADKSAFRAKRNNQKKGVSAMRPPSTDFTTPDFAKKILHASWHPTENTIAVAATNNLFIFSAVV